MIIIKINNICYKNINYITIYLKGNKTILICTTIKINNLL